MQLPNRRIVPPAASFTPPEGSQYYVAPFVQEIFDSVINHSRKDIVEAIKANTAMTLE